MQRACCLFGQRADALSAREADAIARLGVAYAKAEADAEVIKGSASMTDVAAKLDEVMKLLGVPKESRAYRASFTANYKNILPRGERYYHELVLEEGLEQQDVIWINGQAFRFAAATLSAAAELRSSWHSLGLLLRCFSEAARGTRRPTRGETVACLATLDRSWATFERCHITELMGIESGARGLVAEAAEAERRLAELEESGGELRAQRHALVLCIAELNAVANSGGRGRDDLSSDVLEMALELQGQGAAAALASDLLAAFANLRVQIRTAAANLEALDPCLHRNAKLAGGLEDFEKSWEAARQYLSDPTQLRAFSSAAQDLQELQRVVPAFAPLCEQCDVELFLVLPRLLWLSFLEKPDVGPLFQTLLPEHIENGQPASEKLRQLVTEYRKVVQQLGDGSWALLAGEVLRKGCEMDEPASNLVQEAQCAVDKFLLQLEGWSMELQRHRAQDFNGLVALLLECLGHA